MTAAASTAFPHHGTRAFSLEHASSDHREALPNGGADRFGQGDTDTWAEYALTKYGIFHHAILYARPRMRIRIRSASAPARAGSL